MSSSANLGVMSEAEAPESLRLVSARSGLRYALHGKPLHGGDTLALCCSGGWLIGRFEWNSAADEPPRLHCSIELGGGRVAPFSIELPEGALMVRQTTGIGSIWRAWHDDHPIPTAVSARGNSG
jgi:hypothetical protein